MSKNLSDLLKAKGPGAERGSIVGMAVGGTAGLMGIWYAAYEVGTAINDKLDLQNVVARGLVDVTTMGVSTPFAYVALLAGAAICYYPGKVVGRVVGKLAQEATDDFRVFRNRYQKEVDQQKIE